MSERIHHQIVIVGGGAAGVSVAARLRKHWFHKPDVAIIEPSSKHYFQPQWTLVGAGLFPKEVTERDEASVIPRGVRWIQDAVAEFRPGENLLTTRDGRTISYEWLVVAAGIQINWSQIKGLEAALGQGGVCSNYSFAHVDKTWDYIRNFAGGTALFTQPAGAIKCGGAPQKIMYLADDYFRSSGVRDASRVIFASAADQIFAVEKYRRTLEQVIARKEIETRYRRELIEVRGDTREAIFRLGTTGELETIPYDLLHVTPPMSAPSFIAQSPLADAQGWVEVDKYTLRHLRYPRVFSLGDCASLPTSKTAAAIRKQAPTLVHNLEAALRGEPLTAVYDGYTSCPLVTGYGKLVMAEFDYDKTPQETFPFDQSKERWSMYLVKKYVLPRLYWDGMLKGRA